MEGIAFTGSRSSITGSDEVARGAGLARSPVDPLLVFHMVFGKSVPDISLNAVANLGYADGRFLKPVYPGDTAPMRVLVGGEVRNPGWVDMLGDMDALQATMAAGGFTHGAKGHQVLIIRRGRNGQAMRRIVDLQNPLEGKGQLVALRRFDIIYVPRTNVAEAGVFMEQWVNNLIPGGIMNYFTYKAFGQ